MSEPERRCACGAELPEFVVTDHAIVDDLRGRLLPRLTIKPRYCAACATDTIAAARSEARERRAQRCLERSGLVGVLREQTLDTYPTDAAAEAAKADALRWLANLVRYQDAAFAAATSTAPPTHVRGSNLILFGGVGAGKTGLATGLVRALCDEGVHALFVNFRDYLWSLARARERNLRIDISPHRAAMLVLDDLGAEQPTRSARAELATLVQRRADAALPTVVTSNYDLNEISEILGHEDPVQGRRIVSRLAQGATQVRFRGNDRRLVAA